MDESVQEWVIKLGAWVRDPAVDIHDQLRCYVSVNQLQVLHPDLHKLLELGESVGAGYKLV